MQVRAGHDSRRTRFERGRGAYRWSLGEPGLLLGLLICIGGCPAPPKTEPLISRWQVGRGDLCSMASALLIGPTLGRTRNEGYFKSDSEIQAMIPLVGLSARARNAERAAEGMSWAAYRETLRHPFNQNNYTDVQQTVSAAWETGAVPEQRVRRISRELATGSFTHVDAILAALDRGALDRDQARAVLASWLRLTCRDHRFNYHLHPGNQAMLSRLVEAELLTRAEASGLAAAWIANLPRLTPDLIDDAVHVNVLEQSDAVALIRREWCLLQAHLDPAVLGSDVAACGPEVELACERIKARARQEAIARAAAVKGLLDD